MATDQVSVFKTKRNSDPIYAIRCRWLASSFQRNGSEASSKHIYVNRMHTAYVSSLLGQYTPTNDKTHSPQQLTPSVPGACCTKVSSPNSVVLKLSGPDSVLVKVCVAIFYPEQVVLKSRS